MQYIVVCLKKLYIQAYLVFTHVLIMVLQTVITKISRLNEDPGTAWHTTIVSHAKGAGSPANHPIIYDLKTVGSLEIEFVVVF